MKTLFDLNHKIKKYFCVLICFCLGNIPVSLMAASRLKDISSFEGVRENILVGYGLVVGLNGTGDNPTSSPFTGVSLTSMLERMGIKIPENSVRSKNVAAVMVTATLPPFARQGTRIDVNVSTLGDAKSLRGGTLLVTPLQAADGEVYAVAQGSLAVSGFTAEGKAESITRGVPTSARISNGAIIEKEIPYHFNRLEKIAISLNNADFTTARRVSESINQRLKSKLAHPLDSATIQVTVPASFKNDLVHFMTVIEQISVEPDLPAKIIIDEQSGVIVMGENVRISRVAIAHGNLTIGVTEQAEAMIPGPFTAVENMGAIDRTTITVDENTTGRMRILDQGASLRELVNGLNALGVGPRDLISIMQVIKAAGALQADIEVI